MQCGAVSSMFSAFFMLKLFFFNRSDKNLNDESNYICCLDPFIYLTKTFEGFEGYLMYVLGGQVA